MSCSASGPCTSPATTSVPIFSSRQSCRRPVQMPPSARAASSPWLVSRPPWNAATGAATSFSVSKPPHVVERVLLEIRFQLAQPDLDRPAGRGGVVRDVLFERRGERRNLADGGDHGELRIGDCGLRISNPGKAVDRTAMARERAAFPGLVACSAQPLSAPRFAVPTSRSALCSNAVPQFRPALVHLHAPLPERVAVADGDGAVVRASGRRP